MRKVPFPQYLSRPMQLLWFATDELAVLTLFAGFAMMFGGLYWILPFAGGYWFLRMKREYPRGFLRHVFYFIGVTNLKGYPEYWEKEFQE